MKRRKFGVGGDIEGGADEGVGGDKPAAMSFGEAFKAARKAGQKTFQWTKPDGTMDTFSTRYESEEPKKSVPRRKPTEAPKLTTSLPKVTVSGKRPSTMSGAFPQNQDDAKRPSIYANSVFATERDRPAKVETAPKRAPYGATDADETRNPRLMSKDALEAAVKKPYKAGGGIKKYARGGGIESKGKTRGRIC